MAVVNRNVVVSACLLWLVQLVFCEFPSCLTTTPSDSISLNVDCKKLDTSVEVGHSLPPYPISSQHMQLSCELQRELVQIHVERLVRRVYLRQRGKFHFTRGFVVIWEWSFGSLYTSSCLVPCEKIR
ncbi:hypothetical protein Y032_0290g1553 [Ancylostoma ceylanicum]|uniref:ZP domain-containing protein n=1 Tax=Ancylostoma ceylanicum TaxID=53326 RepID=A0A016S5B8_9BILA|nr:hypothetical protein Y032_0290g1553 [Ancylostoma ceylanicum]